ncbi:MAG: glycosyltransferase family 9 protein, partial [Ignavibacteria bacterium]|nr:glycosyltransferase family 9 protein [Ignavibacteria bacterium]
DAVGDVLRTTSILPGLKEKYPQGHITWLTRENAKEIFYNNNFVDRVLVFESIETQYFLSIEKFDLVLNLDSSPLSSAICSFVNGVEKLGFGLDEKGKVYPINPEAEEWFLMGAFDDLKKNNTRTYQAIILDIARIKTNNYPILLFLTDAEKTFAESFLRLHNIDSSKKIIGLNTGAGPRWKFKSWTLEGFESLIQMILEKTDYYVFLYGGPHEKDRNEYLAKIDSIRVIDTGTNNTLRKFFALLNLCDLLVTGDTLAMHAATALRKKIIALFGPTSANEIETYGLITKIQSDLDCLVCYKMDCDFDPNCMNSIKPETIFQKIQELICD